MMVSPKELEPIERYYFLLLYAPDATDKFAKPIKGKTWCQKEMFLLSRSIPELEKEAEYTPHNMGSFSEVVEEIQDQFDISGFTEMVDESIKLTLEGRKLAEATWKDADDSEKALVMTVKTWLNDLSYFELLGLIYNEYPDMSVNSEMRADVDAKREEIALSLFKKGKVPLDKAAQIAKLSRAKFLEIAKRKGIDIDAETNAVLSDKVLLKEIQQSKEDSKSGRLIPWESIKGNQ